MIRFIAAALGVASLLLAPAAASPAAPKAFIAVIVSDADASAEWYARVFGLEEANSVSGERFEVRVLSGPDVIVEIIQSIPPAPDYVNRSKGIFKAGFVIADFDARVAAWREDGVQFLGEGGVFYDEALKLSSTILLDPDGNRIQAFGEAAE